MLGSSGTQNADAGLDPALRGLATLVDAAVDDRRVAAEHDARRLERIHAALEFGAAHADVFVDSRFSGAAARDLARRAVIGELAAALTMTERRVETLAGHAAILCRRLPSALSALRAGEIDYAQAVVIIDTIDALDPATVERRPELVSELDRRLAERAVTCNTAQLRRAARRLTERLQADSIDARHSRARAGRRVELEPARDGMAWLHLLLPAADALLIHDRLTSAARASTRAACTGASAVATAADATVIDETVTAATRADLARDLLLHGVPSTTGATGDVFSRVRPTVHVTVPVQTLLARSSPDPAGEPDHADLETATLEPAVLEPAVLDGYGPIDSETARHLTAHAPSFTRLLTHPVTGVVLDVDRTSYRVPADLRRWLQVRDETCRFPGCTRSAIRCDLDHSEDWAGPRRGKTAHDNLAHLCTAHHHVKHDTAWRLTHVPGGTLEWRSQLVASTARSRRVRLRDRALSPHRLVRSPPRQARVTAVPP